VGFKTLKNTRPGLGSSKGKFPYRFNDRTLSPPALPSLPDLSFSADFTEKFRRQLDELPARFRENDALIARLEISLKNVKRNPYNIEVLLSLARFLRHHLFLLDSLGKAGTDLGQAALRHSSGDPLGAVTALSSAADRIDAVNTDRLVVFEALKTTWEKSRLPRNADTETRKFLHVMDDVKDHFADRRADLSYLTAPEESIGLPEYAGALRRIIKAYSKASGLAVRQT